MALELNGTTGVSLVQDGVVTAADLASGAITASALPAGSVLQVVTARSSQYLTTSSTSFISTNLQASITPSSTSNEILIIATVFGGKAATDTAVAFQVDNGSGTKVFSIVNGLTNTDNSDLNLCAGASSVYKYSPSTTTALTYRLQIKKTHGSGDVFFNWYENDANATFSTITLMEIAG